MMQRSERHGGATVRLSYTGEGTTRQLYRLDVQTGARGVVVQLEEPTRTRQLTWRIGPRQWRTVLLPADVQANTWQETPSGRGRWDGPQIRVALVP